MTNRCNVCAITYSDAIRLSVDDGAQKLVSVVVYTCLVRRQRDLIAVLDVVMAVLYAVRTVDIRRPMTGSQQPRLERTPASKPVGSSSNSSR